MITRLNTESGPIIINKISQKRRKNLFVSKVSNYSDQCWDFVKEIPNKNITDYRKIIDWNRFVFNDKTKITDAKHEELYDSTRNFIYSLLFSSSSRVKRITILSKIYPLRKLLKWMASRAYNKFAELDKTACQDYLKYVLSLSISKSRKGALLDILVDLFRQKSVIDDAISEHPFNYEPTGSLVGNNLAEQEKNKTLRIPEIVLADLIGKALKHVETKVSIINIYHEYRNLRKQFKNRSANFRDKARTRFCQTHNLPSIHALNRDVTNLRMACYIIIAFFSGMRDSEVVSIQDNCIKKKKKKGSGIIYKIFSLTYKPHTQPKLEHWMVPKVVKTAVDVLSLLTKPLREESGLKELFLIESGDRVMILSNQSANGQLKKFIKNNNVALYNGKRWRIHTHQFRRSFAYYMMKENKCNLKFLQTQFKHLSMDMTIWYAETDDEDLKQEVYAMSIEVTRDILRPILLDSIALAGKGGQHIADNRDAYFSGKTVREKESLFKEIIADLYVRSTFLGLCIWNPEQARCEAGLECRCNPNICDNAVVTQEHLPLWLRLKEKHEKLLSMSKNKSINRQYIKTQLDTFVMPIINKLQGGSNKENKIDAQKRKSRSPQKSCSKKNGSNRRAYSFGNSAN